MAEVKTEACWDAIYAIGSEDGRANQIPPRLIAKLIELKIATVNATGFPELTDYGKQAYTVLESGDGVIAELAGVWC